MVAKLLYVLKFTKCSVKKKIKTTIKLKSGIHILKIIEISFS